LTGDAIASAGADGGGGRRTDHAVAGIVTRTCPQCPARLPAISGDLTIPTSVRSPAKAVGHR
jgi:hypothetical protein